MSIENFEPQEQEWLIKGHLNYLWFLARESSPEVSPESVKNQWFHPQDDMALRNEIKENLNTLGARELLGIQEFVQVFVRSDIDEAKTKQAFTLIGDKIAEVQQGHASELSSPYTTHRLHLSEWAQNLDPLHIKLDYRGRINRSKNR